MKSSAPIVHGGSWLTRHTVGRPKARFFGFLSVIWLFVSIGASFPFWDGWPKSFGDLEWLCSALLVPQPVFVLPTVAFWLAAAPLRFGEQGLEKRPLGVGETGAVNGDFHRPKESCA